MKILYIGDAMAENRYIECGKIINTHGCAGGIKAESWCNTERDLAGLKRIFLFEQSEYIEHKINKASVFKQFVLLEFSDVTDMDTAMLLKNKTIYALREDFKLANGEFFLVDMIGLDVIDADDGTVYGHLQEIINRGASDIYVIQTSNGERMMPAVDEFVISVDINKGIFVRPIEGMLD